MTFYEQTLRKLMSAGQLSPTDSVLVACGGPFDARVMQAVGLKDVVITNLDARYDGYCAPFEWEYKDVENLELADGSVDWAMAHAGLHHCGSPHRGVLELMRVARKGVLVVEARDSLLIRTAVRLGFTTDYEIESVALDKERLGGLRNTGVPNYVYRWTEREVRKTVESARPDRRNDLRFFYGLTLPTQRLAMSGPVKRALAGVLGVLATIAHHLLPGQGNQFGFAILNSDADKPWILRDAEGPRLSPDYKLGFDTARYKKPAAQSPEGQV